ncbi:alternative photosystem I reaction center subunit X [Pseudanabaena sp. lw0831]|uniref:photosystem I reaction center subunit PsaK n=1 Tax=Pseudanabaena sp. lw0831 TaxID=1357935 RepID=UPI001916C23F|nr:photosystem I reaction center subunit PsaK [Pseudanabaena sp. lw0831]GBO56178.1 alternative photosystem I reaction center subunit X [Pseudanabaena sp. lw0831]
MTHLAFNLLAAVPATSTWSPSVGLLMITANAFALVVARYGIKVKGVGPSLPVELPGLFSGFGLAELLAVTSFGHVLGAGLILGLAQAGLV